MKMLVCILAIATGLEASAQPLTTATFQDLSRTVFAISCTSCHSSQNGEPPEAKIDLTSFAALTASNNQVSKHTPFIIPGSPETSRLYLAVQSGDMPATEDGSKGKPLEPEQIQAVYDWIKNGAVDN